MTDTLRIGIAINVMRARLTVVGFNIAIVSFQISELLNMKGGISVPGLTHTVHFRADMALFLSLACSLLAIVAFLNSCAIDDTGTCDHWSFIVGDLLMYFGLANAVTGFFAPLNEQFLLAIQLAPSQEIQITIFRKAIYYLGATAWFVTLYIGPLVTLIRSPFPKTINRYLGLSYILMLAAITWLNYQAFVFEAFNTQTKGLAIPHYLSELFQPIVW
ncbi:hypothetical protein ACE1OE_00315 [Vibrio sp. E150_011]